MAKIAVTGGSGFIGSHLVGCLVDKGHDVTIIDIAPPIFNQEKATFRRVDICHYDELCEALRGNEFIYHLAAEANVDVIHRQPVASTVVNTIGTIHVLEAAKTNGCKRVLFASTEWVYGATDTECVDEKTRLYPPMPNHLYTSHKIAGELALQSYQKQYALDFTIMRFGIPFGPRARKETVTCKFLLAAMAGGTITLNAGGRQYRQFIYVGDLAAGCVACLSEGARNEIININGSEKITILRVVETIRKYLNIPFCVEVKDDGRIGDFDGRLVNSDKAHRLLGWKPEYTYEEAMKIYIEWFRNVDQGKKLSA